MRHISELREILRSQLPMDKRRLDCLAQLLDEAATRQNDSFDETGINFS
jgi:hypothetical protein